MSKHEFYEGIWTIKHIRNGQVIDQEIVHNDLLDDGEETMLDVFFRAQALVSFYARLSIAALIDPTTISDAYAAEPAQVNGYAPVEIERTPAGWPIIDKNGNGDYFVTSKTVTFTAAGGDIDSLKGVYLSNSNTNQGKVIAYAPFSMERTMYDGDSLELQITVTLQ